MFSLQAFIKKGLLEAIGKMADYQIIMSAAGWYSKNVLTETDLEDINNAIAEYHQREAEEAARRAAEEEEARRRAEEEDGTIVPDEDLISGETVE